MPAINFYPYTIPNKDCDGAKDGRDEGIFD